MFVSFRTQDLCNRVTCAINLVQDDVNDFIERSEEQLNHLTRNLRLTLLEQHAWGMDAISSVYFVVLARDFLKNQPPIVSVLLRNYLTLRSRSERVRNAVTRGNLETRSQLWQKKTRSRKTRHRLTNTREIAMVSIRE